MTAEIIRIVLLLAVFAGVFLLVQVVGSSYAKSRSYRGAVNKRLQMIGSGQDREAVIGQLIKNRPTGLPDLPKLLASPADKLQRKLFASNLALTIGQLVLFMGIGLVSIFLLVMLIIVSMGYGLGLGAIIIALLFATALAVVLPLFIIGTIAESRRKKMEHQFPIALDIFVRALRSGHPIASAIDLLTHEMEDPIGTEFGLVSDEVAYGADLITALEQMADRWDLEDMQMFVVSLSVQSQTGGNLAEILDNISRVIRERHQLFLKVKALSSEGRMTALMLTVLPVFAFVTFFLGAPQYYLESAEDPIFIYGAITLAVMYFLGVYIMRRLVDLKV
ncbi:type II secretion system F family protein [Altererythrobacter arenosus]|uniref:Type II secretion system F family protein n=1 Tax=Altererythrobacter arenosus TaxID=3032592 RepID=A0ABY8FRT9_9SPHN|nr:type II secretion system F family protein [Altererythrobacter sp. CAU 1644]WFL76623.1 type II secretion system F family protein [Altererythrobacter sp. CAU 1644]